MLRSVYTFNLISIVVWNLYQDESWDQEKFEQLLTEWMVICDQPFQEVEQPELRRLLEYTHLRPGLHIPSSMTIKRRVMKMGEDAIEGVKQLVEVSLYNNRYWSSENKANVFA